MLKTKKIEKVNNLALKYFVNSLNKSKKAQEYVYGRITKPTVRKFFIGYSPKSGFVEYLNKHDVDESIAREAGLVTFDYNGNALNRFADRIILPIIHANRLVGFGGRTLTEVTKRNPKYINSKTSVLFNKSEVLYGLWRARKEMLRRGYGIIVEGYFDVYGLFEAGVKNSVASCGTALTRDQARLLARYADKVYVMLDGDDAGQEAAKKAKKILKKEKVYGGIMVPPKGMDPFELVTKYGKKGLKRVKIKK